MDQSPLSRAIKTLEDELGARLFERTQRGSSITPAGEVLLEDARRILVAYDLARQNVREACHKFQHRLRVGLSGMTVGLAHPNLTSLLAYHRHASSTIDLVVTECDYGAMLREVRDGLLDVGITLGGVHADDLVVHRLWDDPILGVIAANHQLADRKSVTLADMLAHPLVICQPQNDAAVSERLRELIHQSDPPPRVGHYASSITGMLTLVAAGFGVSFIARAHANMLKWEDVRFVPLIDAAAVFSTCAIRRPGGMSAPLRNLLDRAKTSCGDATIATA
ncbi:DNA-binding transcriptional LysR family regulator [Bordetella tumulicola]